MGPLDTKCVDFLSKRVEKEPFKTTKELQSDLKNEFNVSVSTTTLYLELHNRGNPPFTMKIPDKSTAEKKLERIYDMHLGFQGKFFRLKRCIL